MVSNLWPAPVRTQKKPSKWTMVKNYLCTNLIPPASLTPSTLAHKNQWTPWVAESKDSATNTAKLLPNKICLLCKNSLSGLFFFARAFKWTHLTQQSSPNMPFSAYPLGPWCAFAWSTFSQDWSIEIHGKHWMYLLLAICGSCLRAILTSGTLR